MALAIIGACLFLGDSIITPAISVLSAAEGLAVVNPDLEKFVVPISLLVLAITGAEALYADLGHFGRLPIALAWLLIAFPVLIINYLGQGPLRPYIARLNLKKIQRVPGIAVYPHGSLTTVPLALRSSVAFSNALHEHVVIVVVHSMGVPTIPEDERVYVDDLGCPDDGIVRIEYRVGFNDRQDIPRALALALHKTSELEFDPSQATYVLSVFRIEPVDESERRDWPTWQRRLFRLMEKSSNNRTRSCHLPPERTIVMGAEVTA